MNASTDIHEKNAWDFSVRAEPLERQSLKGGIRFSPTKSLDDRLRTQQTKSYQYANKTYYAIQFSIPAGPPPSVGAVGSSSSSHGCYNVAFDARLGG